MMYLITGGSGSGKSEYAEQLAVSLGGERVYLATMQVYDEEGKQRVARHRAMREGKKFLTLECPSGLETMVQNDTNRQILKNRVVLLECMSNLTANEMFRSDRSMETAELTQERILSGVQALLQVCRDLVIVTNEVFSDGTVYDPGTASYLRALGGINVALAALAEEVTEVVCGIPVDVCR